jgi:hypothetical protein
LAQKGLKAAKNKVAEVLPFGKQEAEPVKKAS